ncbi:MAG: aminopeptidase P family protein [Bacteroidetes bacterium]|nr:aminopeptidase P family protein [Bacteroidota bacterium]
MFNEHRTRLASLYADKPGHIIYISGAAVSHRYNTDFEYPFRQESNFLYLTGVQEPDFALILVPITGAYHLLSPRRDAMFAVWMGFVRTQDQLKQAYNPDHIHFTDELGDLLASLKPESVHVINDTDAARVSELGYTPDQSILADALAWCRVIKSDGEKAELRKAANVANIAHREVMKSIRPGMNECELQAIHEFTCTRSGMRHQPYSGIFASGKGAAVLHYVDNNRVVDENDLFLLDAGAESNGYAADITRTYPANGVFNERQAAIYDICLNMLDSCIADARPGVEMEELHLKAARLLLEGFLDLGLVRGEVDELMEANIFALFFPHGLGHFLGLDTHDVGGYPKGVDRIDRPGLRYLRARRLLEPGMVITIEPGIYFIPALLEPAFENPEQARFLNVESLRGYLDFGGIRIEDNLIITEDGHENLTDVPKSRADIEAWMRG